MNLQQMYDILLKNNLSASQKHVYFYIFRGGRVMNLQQMYDILLKNNSTEVFQVHHHKFLYLVTCRTGYLK